MIKDSGKRREFDSGAVRDVTDGKGRYDLLPSFAVHELALIFENGAKKYGDANCYKGIPNSSFIDSAKRHIGQFERGEWDEKHLVHALWNIAMAVDQQERVRAGKLDPKFDDIGVRVVLPDASEPGPCGDACGECDCAETTGVPERELIDPKHCKDYNRLCHTIACPDCEMAYKKENW